MRKASIVGKFLAMGTPEQRARELIDAQLVPAGWIVQDRDQFDRRASLDVAARANAIVVADRTL